MKKTWINVIIGFISFLTIGFILGVIVTEKKYKTKENNIIKTEIKDTLYIKNDSIICYTKKLDSIKNDTIKKIYNLNDSSTIELFFKLVSE